MRKAVTTTTTVVVVMIVLLLGVTSGICAAGDCCMPEVTAKLAVVAAFVDIVGIKLGILAQQAAG